MGWEGGVVFDDEVLALDVELEGERRKKVVC